MSKSHFAKHFHFCASFGTTTEMPALFVMGKVGNVTMTLSRDFHSEAVYLNTFLFIKGLRNLEM